MVSFGSSSETVGASSTSGTISVTTNGSSCGWTATSDAAWLTIDSGGTGSGTSGTIAFSVSENTTGSQRVGTISVSGGPSYTVTQSGAAAPDAPTSLSASAGDQSATISFTAPASDGGLAITNYEYSLDGGGTWTAFSPSVTT